ncbi:MAG: FkbM family methyltransferase, partial [Halopseudomonas aestusnigri]
MTHVVEDTDFLLSNHVVYGEGLFPAAGFLSLAASVREVEYPFRITNAQWLKPLSKAACPVSLDIKDYGEEIRISGIEGLYAGFNFSDGKINSRTLLKQDFKTFQEALSHSEIYTTFSSYGLDYKGLFTALEDFQFDEFKARASLKARTSVRKDVPDPGLLDAAIQGVLLHIHKTEDSDRLFVPFSVAEFVCHRPLPEICELMVKQVKAGADGNSYRYDLMLVAMDGSPLVEIVDLCVKAYDAPSIRENWTVAATFTAEPIAAPLATWSSYMGAAADINFAPYNQIFQQLLNPDSQLNNGISNVRFVLLRLEDLQSQTPSHLETPSENKIDEVLEDGARHQLPNGLKLAHLRTYETDYLYDEIFIQKTYAKEGINFPDEAVVIDIGANIGMFSLFVAGRSKNARIYACEPSPVTFEVLRKNLELYAPEALPLPIGVAETDSEAEFTFYPESSVFSGFHAEDTEDKDALRAIVTNEVSGTDRLQDGQASEQYLEAMLDHRLKREAYTCQLRSVSSLIAEHNLERIDLLKVDAEKCELEVLAGIADTDWPKINQIVVEVHDKTRKILDEVEDILRKRGFYISTIEEHALENSGLYNVYGRRQQTLEATVETGLEKTLGDLVAACSQASSISKAPLILGICPPSPAFIAKTSSAERRWLEALLINGLIKASNISVLRLEDFESAHPWDDSYDAQRDAMGRIPYTATFFEAMGNLLARRVHLLRRPPYKVIALDCDNTLWSGVVGEVGSKGLKISPAFQALQEFMQKRKEQGLLLCLVSKNEEADVREVFEARVDMVLSWDDITAQRINWEPKSSNLRALADELNLSCESFIFLDDNPVECAEVRSNCPEVLTLQLPEVSTDIPKFLERVWAFDTTQITVEDGKRTELYKQNIARKTSLVEALTFKDFIDSLDLDIHVALADPADYSRMAQLTVRTNQFNTYKEIKDETEVASLAERPEGGCLSVRVADKFGDYGLCGLAIFEEGAGFLSVVSLLLSCRVLGRGVEHALLATLGAEAKNRGFASVQVTFVPTNKNSPADIFLHEAGPSEALEVEDQTLFLYDADAVANLTFNPENVSVTPAAVEVKQPSAGITAEWSFMQRTGALGTTVPAERSVPQTGGVENLAQSLVLKELSNLLAVEPADIDCAVAFTDFGLDSIGSIDLIVRLNEVLNIVLPPSTLFDHICVDALCSYLCNEHGDAFGIAEEPSVPFGAADPQKPIVEKLSHKTKLDDRGRLNDVAVVGFSGRFPGAIDVEAFWELLTTGRSAITDVPKMLWDGAAVQGREPGAAYCTKGGFIQGMELFDAAFFGISDAEASTMDPQQRLFLQESYAALEQAGYAAPQQAGAAWGVYVGSDGGDYDERLKAADRAPDGNTFIGNDTSILAARIAYFLNLQGGAVALDTACSSSLTAVHMGCRDLISGDLDLVVAGGVSLRTTPKYHILCSQRDMLAADGNCRPFDDRAEGFVIGDAVGAVVLKRLEDALADGDPIHGIIRGSALNQDGTTNGITASNSLSQTALLRKTYGFAQVDPSEISFVEAHGTGTLLGDSIEVQALTRAFGKQTDKPKIALGSVKGNVGHCLHAAGITSLIKMLLCLRHHQLPPTINHNKSNRHIDFGSTPFYVNTSLCEWQTQNGNPRLGALSALGFNGTNVHMVIEEAPKCAAQSSSAPAHLIMLSARTKEALARRVNALLYWLDDTQADLSVIAYSLACLPTHSHRVAFSVTSLDELRARLEDLDTKKNVLITETVEKVDPAMSAVFDQALKGVRSDLSQPRDDAHYRELIGTLAALFVNGSDFDPAFLYLEKPRRTSLPSYPFEGKIFWVDADQSHKTKPVVNQFVQISAEEITSTAPMTGSLDDLLRHFISGRLNVVPSDVSANVRFIDLGLSSLDLVHMAQALEAALATTLSPSLAFDHITINAMVAYLEDQYGREQVLFGSTLINVQAVPISDLTSDAVILSCVQQGLWSLQVGRPSMTAY